MNFQHLQLRFKKRSKCVSTARARDDPKGIISGQDLEFGRKLEICEWYTKLSCCVVFIIFGGPKSCTGLDADILLGAVKFEILQRFSKNINFYE